MSDRASFAKTGAPPLLAVDWLPLLLLVGAAAFFVVTWSAASGTGTPAYDIYQYYYPNMLAALDGVKEGGRGLLWSPYNDCGQPFFGSIHVGLLSPSNLFFLLVTPEHALRAVVAFNMTVAGVFAYLLCRELGVGRLAAFCGALAFELSNAMVNVSAWSPMHAGPLVWMPAVMLLCERILRAPTITRGLALAAALSMAVLPGFPQTVAFMYQLVGLRVAWEFASRRVAQPSRTMVVLALGLLAPPLLTAIQLLPGIELARLSVRNLPLGANEVGGAMSWAALQKAVMSRREVLNPLVLVPFMLACVSLSHSQVRRPALFYLAAALLFFVLAFGPATPIYGLYTRLPFGSLFRMPVRFLWVSGFCLSVLTALGMQAVLDSSVASRARWWRVVAILAAVMAAVIYAVLGRGFSRPEWILGTLALAGIILAVCAPRWHRWAAVAITMALTVNLLWFPLPILMQAGITTKARLLPYGRLLTNDDVLLTNAPVFASLRERMTSQDRVYSAHRAAQLAFGSRTASLFDVPSVQDYGPTPTLRYAQYYVLMRRGQQLRSFLDLSQYGSPIPVAFRKRLLNLAAGRYLVVDTRASILGDALQPPTTLLTDTPTIQVFENPDALARARFVPRVEVVPDANELLRRLASGSDDLRQIALVEELPPSRFTGSAVSEAGTVEFVTDEPEHIVLNVNAPARGFVVLADQDFPGWSATVNQQPTPIVRANYVFRLVEVPQGTSTIEFRYAPRSVRIGAAISALSLLGVGALLVWNRRLAR